MLNTIGPVWDGNEVWLITAGGAMFAAFPGMYATVFSGLYLPLLAILFAHDPAGLRDRMARQDQRSRVAVVGRHRHRGRARGCPPSCGGWLFASLVRGLPVDADHQMHLSIGDLLNAYTLLGGVAMAGLFLFYGAVFVTLKTQGAVRDDAVRFAGWLALPVDGIGGRVRAVDAGGARQRLDVDGARGRGDRAAVGGNGGVEPRQRRLGVRGLMTVVAAVVVLLFGSLYPNLVPSTLNPDWSLTIHNASSTPLHAEDHDAGRR